MKLSELSVGSAAVITVVGGSGALRQHFLDMGVIPGTEVKVVKLAPMGDPMEIQIRGYELTLRLEDAGQIDIEPVSEISEKHKRVDKIKHTAHPGFGESGKYHNHEQDDKNILPEDTVLTYALVGNQNCGKTTLFNQLTG
ncbi:MAG: FeoA domain-containing protein, partial [Prevotellaceae bacterium]|nr:FeoA domain-containing protein [Prevotellaceae bacterium]